MSRTLQAFRCAHARRDHLATICDHRPTWSVYWPMNKLQSTYPRICLKTNKNWGSSAQSSLKQAHNSMENLECRAVDFTKKPFKAIGEEVNWWKCLFKIIHSMGFSERFARKRWVGTKWTRAQFMAVEVWSDAFHARLNSTHRPEILTATELDEKF